MDLLKSRATTPWPHRRQTSSVGNSNPLDIPVLYLDTCVVLDILRDPARSDVRVHDHESSLALLSTAQSGTVLEVLAAEQASLEFRENVEQVQREARRSLVRRMREIRKLNELSALYGRSRPIDLAHWSNHDKRARKEAERRLQVSATLRETSDAVPNSFLRLNQARSPARRGKQFMKDCVILETCLEHLRSLRQKGRTATALFVSSNTSDCAADDKATIKDEFESLSLEYAPSMGAARGLFKLS